MSQPPSRGDYRIGGLHPAGSAVPAGKVIPRIASLVPAATDLLLAMGAGDHLVAVGNFDNAPQELPRAEGTI